MSWFRRWLARLFGVSLVLSRLESLWTIVARLDVSLRRDALVFLIGRTVDGGHTVVLPLGSSDGTTFREIVQVPIQAGAVIFATLTHRRVTGAFLGTNLLSYGVGAVPFAVTNQVAHPGTAVTVHLEAP